jgi:hypothetical protein
MMRLHNPNPDIACAGALSDQVLAAARKVADSTDLDRTFPSLPDIGERNKPLLPLLIALIDATNAVAAAIADNAWDSGRAVPADLAKGLTAEARQLMKAIQASTEVF